MGRSGPVTRDVSTIALGLAQVRVGNSAANIATKTAVLSSLDSIGALASTKFTGNVEYFNLESGFPLLEDVKIPLREASMLEAAFKEVTPFNLALARGLDPLAAVGATLTLINSVSVAGATAGVISVDDLGGAVSDSFTVVFTSASTYEVIGVESGHVGAGDIGTLFEPDNGGNPYFSIPVNFFDANWLTDESFVFRTTAFIGAAGNYLDAHAGEIALGNLKTPASMRMEAVYTYPNQINHMYIIFPRCNIVSSVEIDLQEEENANVPITFEAKNASSDVVGGDVEWDEKPLGLVYFD